MLVGFKLCNFQLNPKFCLYRKKQRPLLWFLHSKNSIAHEKPIFLRNNTLSKQTLDFKLVFLTAWDHQTKRQIEVFSPQNRKPNCMKVWILKYGTYESERIYVAKFCLPVGAAGTIKTTPHKTKLWLHSCVPACRQHLLRSHRTDSQPASSTLQLMSWLTPDHFTWNSVTKTIVSHRWCVWCGKIC